MIAHEEKDPAHEKPSKDMPKEALNDLPLRTYGGPVHVIDSPRHLAETARRLRREHVLGFDTETRPAFQRGQSYLPALLQLATAEGVWLVHLRRLDYPNVLWEILSDPSILKVGVSLDYDVKQLQLLHPFEPAGFLDLVSLSKPLGYKSAGLRNLAGNILGFRISKGPKTSNWEREPLSEAQVAYAATDAWVGREIYLKLHAMAKAAGI
jgi:ribonuclease D